MGNAPIVVSSDEDPVKDTAVEAWSATIYVAGIVVWVLVWALFMGKATFNLFTSKTRAMHLGFLYTLVLFGVNIWGATQESVGDYAVEISEFDRLQRNSFYLVASLFSFATILNTMSNTGSSSKSISHVVPLLIMVLFFSGACVLSPVWVSTTDPRPTIYMKHIKTVCSIIGQGFMVAALADAFCSPSCQTMGARLAQKAAAPKGDTIEALAKALIKTLETQK